MRLRIPHLHRVALLVFLAISAPPAMAVSPEERLADPALEARARAISGEIRCPKCQSESIDESNADIAKDLRLLIRERLTAGDSDEAIRAFLVSRYGEFVLLKPRFGAHTMLLWLAPVILLGFGGVLVVVSLRRRAFPGPALATEPAELSDDEKRNLAAILKSGNAAPPQGKDT
jgi:cytochrome c-type biogenesis protein CcmH